VKELAQKFQAAQLAALSIGRFTVVVPLQDLQSLEPVLDVNADDAGMHGIGSIELRDGPSTVYCLDETFALREEPPFDQRICAVLSDGAGGHLCLVCSSVEALPADALKSFVLPACMATAATPLAGLALLAGQVVGRTSGAALAQFVADSIASSHPGGRTEHLLDATRA
jgi:hypothetical protein